MSRAEEILSHVDEAGAKLKLRIRNGKVQRKLVCPKFFKKDGMACFKLTATEAKTLSKKRKKTWKRKLRQKFNIILKKRARSLGIRKAVIGDIQIDDKGGDNDKGK